MKPGRGGRYELRLPPGDARVWTAVGETDGTFLIPPRGQTAGFLLTLPVDAVTDRSQMNAVQGFNLETSS